MVRVGWRLKVELCLEEGCLEAEAEAEAEAAGCD